MSAMLGILGTGLSQTSPKTASPSHACKITGLRRLSGQHVWMVLLIPITLFLCISFSVTSCPNPSKFTTDEIITTESFEEDPIFEDLVWYAKIFWLKDIFTTNGKLIDVFIVYLGGNVLTGGIY